MRLVDASVLILEGNSFEWTLFIRQNQDEIQDYLEERENKHFELRDDLVYKKANKNKLLFYRHRWKQMLFEQGTMSWDTSASVKYWKIWQGSIGGFRICNKKSKLIFLIVWNVLSSPQSAGGARAFAKHT